MFLELLEQLDRLLCRCSDGLALVHPADVQDWEQVVDVAGDLVLEVCSNGIECVDGHSLRLRVLRLLNLLDQIWKELLVVVFEIDLNVEDE